LERTGTLLSERLSQETGYSYSTCQRAAKKANLRPYKITSVQELGDVDNDKDKRVRYCLWFREFVHDNPRVWHITCFTDEAWFHLSGYVNAQNSRIWGSEIPHEIAESPLRPQNVGVWCVISGSGPIFDTIVDSALYCRILYDFEQQLDDVELTQGYFQPTLQDLKDNISAEIRNITEETLQRVTANMQTRVEACLLENGAHFQHLL
jgi:hypothetical protein